MNKEVFSHELTKGIVYDYHENGELIIYKGRVDARNRTDLGEVEEIYISYRENNINELDSTWFSRLKE